MTTSLVHAQNSLRWDQAGVFLDIPADARLEIEAAMPKEAAAAPRAPRRVLVFHLHVRDGQPRPGHPSVPYAAYALQHMGRSTGAYETWFSSDPEVFRRENLRQFDVVVFNNTAGVLTDDESLRNDLLDYIHGGGGFVGLHAAGATFCQWPRYDFFPAYGEMLGGFENGGHPWKPDEWINLKVDDPGHPVAAAFGGENFDVSDEVFQFTEPYSRNRQRVVLSIDTARTDMGPQRRILPERRADGDLAISWVKRYGRGRVFYTSLGHNAHLNWNPRVLRHYLDGIQFAAGDLEAATVPSAKLTPAMRAQEQLGWRLGIEAYTFRDKTLFETIEAVDALGLAYVGGLNVQEVSSSIPKKFDHHLTDAELREVRAKLVAHGLSMLTYYVFDIPGDEAGCRAVFEFGRKMGIEVFISEPKREHLDLVERFCEEYGIKLALHNHGPRLSPFYMHPENIVRECANRSPLIGAACDFGHWAKEGIDPATAVRTLGRRVITIQMHDQSEFTAEGRDVPWGSGKVDLPGILEFLHRERITPVMFGLEYSHNWGKSLPEIEASIEFFNQRSIGLAGQ